MKLATLIVAAALLGASPAMAQERTFTFRLTESQANSILQLLGQAPYNVAAPLIGEIQKQAASQLPKEPAQAPKTSPWPR